jgi:radical SAM superfamily enzyme YgiQ (UPF0313 family)
MDVKRVLLVYPEFGRTYWGMQYALPIVRKKATMPPLGLLTVAALSPPELEFRLNDLNCGPLSESDLEWAEMVCFSAMLPQKEALFRTARRCRDAGKLVVFGGPYPTACPEECEPHCDVQVLNEAEITWPLFLDDLAKGTHQKVYTTTEKPDITRTPIPRFDLVTIDDYASVPIQFSRGCPFQCEFCDIIVMFGRTPRTKTPAQVLAELDAVYRTGYRGAIFIVDDNFIGNRKAAKGLLPEIRAWNEARRNPFIYGTEASVDLAQDDTLLELLREAHFTEIFLGIETPSMESLNETRKFQNLRSSLSESVERIRAAGLMIQAGFIIGFDNDGEDIFDRQIEFIRQTSIPFAMVGLLGALPGTPLYERLQKAGRLVRQDRYEKGEDQCGDTNVVTLLPRRTLLEGYRRVLETVYSPREYFERCLSSLSRLPRPPAQIDAIHQPLSVFRALTLIARVLWNLPRGYRRESWRFIWATLRRFPDKFPAALANVLVGVHFYRFTFEHVGPRLDERLRRLSNPPAGDVPDFATVA